MCLSAEVMGGTCVHAGRWHAGRSLMRYNVKTIKFKYKYDAKIT